jgi:hypothetical protein
MRYKYIYLLISLLVLNNAPLLFREMSDPIANFSYDVCQQLTMVILSTFIYFVTPVHRFKERGCAILVSLMFCLTLVNYISYMLSFPLFYAQYPLAIIAFIHLFYNYLINWRGFHGLKFRKDKSYFVFKKPVNFIDFFIALVRNPVSSFSIINNSQWYKYSKKKQKMHIIDTDNIDYNKYFLFEVKSIESKDLDALVGTPWGIRKSNCITAFKPIFEKAGIKLNFFDFIPSVFAYNFFKLGGYNEKVQIWR